MPSSMTHAYFGMDVYEKLDDRIRDKIKDNIDDYKSFCQSHDVFYFYNFSGKLGKKMRQLGRVAHNHKTQDFFVKLITTIKENKLENNGQVMAYLYGCINHYMLDTIVHPFVVYKTGIFNKNDKNTYKYNGLHYEMEFYIDIYMIYQKEKVEASRYKGYKKIFNAKPFTKELKELMDSTYKDVYNEENVSKYYYSALQKMKHFFRIYNYDSIGIKKIIYRAIDFFSTSRTKKVTPLSYYVPHKKKIHYLNLEKKQWSHPMVESEFFDYSFFELYIIAMAKATKLIESVDELLDNSKINEKELKLLFKNVSYLTNKDCESKEKIQFFEF
ncbi:MAG: zinc dependent phospholipase C family protein [bacterium]|nr:zinc dependent phospholipase C family protein [bacterium]